VARNYSAWFRSENVHARTIEAAPSLRAGPSRCRACRVAPSRGRQTRRPVARGIATSWQGSSLSPPNECMRFFFIVSHVVRGVPRRKGLAHSLSFLYSNIMYWRDCTSAPMTSGGTCARMAVAASHASVVRRLVVRNQRRTMRSASLSNPSLPPSSVHWSIAYLVMQVCDKVTLIFQPQVNSIEPRCCAA